MEIRMVPVGGLEGLIINSVLTVGVFVLDELSRRRKNIGKGLLSKLERVLKCTEMIRIVHF